MRKLNIFLLSLLAFIQVHSQKIHSSVEILKVMANSKLTYDIGTLTKKIETPNYSQKRNKNNIYRTMADSATVIREFKPNESALSLYDNAETYLSNKNNDSALKYYKLALEADTNFFKVLTSIGQIYEANNDLEKAEFWYKKAIQKNYIDFMAHWFLADIYFQKGKISQAKDEITIALILDRNNPSLKSAFFDILKKVKLGAEDWYFTPQMELEKISDTRIRISFDKKWIGYAMAKALWRFEPGYRTSMGVKEGKYSILEDRECLINELVALANANIDYKKDIQLLTLRNAIDNKYLNEYILFEIVLPRNPESVYQLSQELILKIKDYILTVRQVK